MIHVSFFGSQLAQHTGRVVDMWLFFRCVKIIAQLDESNRNWDVLTDRLYGSYLRPEEVEPARELMSHLQVLMANYSPHNFDWSGDEDLIELSLLKFDSPSLDIMFARYFDTFEAICDHDAKVREYEGMQYYDPIRILADDPQVIYEQMARPLHVLEDVDFSKEGPYWFIEPKELKGNFGDPEEYEDEEVDGDLLCKSTYYYCR